MKICCPLTPKDLTELSAQIAVLNTEAPDIAELRADYFINSIDITKAFNMLNTQLPVIFTLRRADEGGARHIAQIERQKLINAAIASEKFAYIDIELQNGADFNKPLITAAKEKGMSVIISYHDFNRTPEKAEIIKLLNACAAMGADIPKIAVMPLTESDVSALIKAAKEYTASSPYKPVIAVSMGELGFKSRLESSWLTFACLKEETAPGQISVRKLKEILKLCKR